MFNMSTPHSRRGRSLTGDQSKKNEALSFLNIDKLLLFKNFSSEGTIRHMLIGLNSKLMMYYPGQVHQIASELTRLTNFRFGACEKGLDLIGIK